MQRFRRDDEQERMSPEEAKEFLAVYAERTAEADDDATRLGDVSELLGLDLDEARGILAEARERVLRQKARPPARHVRRSLLVLPVLCAVALLGTMGLASRLGSGPRPAEIAVGVSEPSLAAPAEVLPPEGFDLVLNAPIDNIVSTEWSGPPTRFGTDFSVLSEGEARSIRQGLSRSIVKVLDDASRGRISASGLRKIGLSLRIQGGDWVRFTVPLAPFTLPLDDNPGGRADLTRRVEQAIDSKWQAIVRGRPR